MGAEYTGKNNWESNGTQQDVDSAVCVEGSSADGLQPLSDAFMQIQINVLYVVCINIHKVCVHLCVSCGLINKDEASLGRRCLN